MLEKLDRNSQLATRLKKLELEIDEIHSTLNEIKNNLQIYNQAERQLLKEMDSRLSLQLKSQFDEMHYLQYNLQRTQQSSEFVEKTLSEVRRVLYKHFENQLGKEDLQVIESFLRLIAANQMIQETYFQ